MTMLATLQRANGIGRQAGALGQFFLCEASGQARTPQLHRERRVLVAVTNFWRFAHGELYQ
jgi:hypothetical protein